MTRGRGILLPAPPAESTGRTAFIQSLGSRPRKGVLLSTAWGTTALLSCRK